MVLLWRALCRVSVWGEGYLDIQDTWICAIFVGSLAELNLIWNLADILNGLMAVPNIIAVLLLSALSGTIALETKKYAGKHIEDKDEKELPVIKNSK